MKCSNGECINKHFAHFVNVSENKEPSGEVVSDILEMKPQNICVCKFTEIQLYLYVVYN